MILATLDDPGLTRDGANQNSGRAMLLPPLPTPPADALVLLHEWEKRHPEAEKGSSYTGADGSSPGQGDDLLWEDDDADGTPNRVERRREMSDLNTDPDLSPRPTCISGQRRSFAPALLMPNLLLLSRHPALVEVSARSKTLSAVEKELKTDCRRVGICQITYRRARRETKLRSQRRGRRLPRGGFITLAGLQLFLRAAAQTSRINREWALLPASG